MGLEGPCARSPLRGSAAAHLDKRRAARSRQRRERTPNPNSTMSFARHGLRQQLRRLSPYFPRLGTMNDISSLRVDPPVTQVDRLFQGWRPEGCDRVALVLQGGGALGAYQAGVYQALHECGIEPDWVSGVSIGAINAAIIAGNVPDQRLSRSGSLGVHHRPKNLAVHSGWRRLSQGAQRDQFVDDDDGRPARATSYYDNGPLRETLQRLVDFSIINGQAIRFAVGAVNVLTGNFAYFDNAREPIEPEHIIASGSLVITSEHDQRRVHLGGRTDDRFGLWYLCVAAVDGRLQELSLARIDQAAVGEPAMPERRAVRSDRSILSGATLRVRGALA